MDKHNWTTEEFEYLKEIYIGNSYEKITQLMNEKFEYQFRKTQISSMLKKLNLKNGLDGRFKKGNISHNKGKKGWCPSGVEKGWFKKGHVPLNHRPLGSERINAYGYTEVKTEEPNKWELKHRIIYKEHYGEIPEGYSVIFADRNKLNLDIENLILVSRNKLKVMNQKNLIKEDPRETKTGSLIADVLIKTYDLKKRR